MNSVFADTFYWIALANPKDQYHERVLNLSRGLASTLIVTTDEVLTEFLAFCAADAQLRAAAAAAVQDILRSADARVIPQRLFSGRIGTVSFASR